MTVSISVIGLLFFTSATSAVNVASYLSKFGYLEGVVGNKGAAAMSDYQPALLNFQRSYGLKATGQLDPATEKLMMTPRCGLPDSFNRRRGKRSLLTKWPTSGQLTYFVSSYPANLDYRRVESAVWHALYQWQNVSLFTFARARDAASANITIGFPRSTEHDTGCTYRFEAETLAHAFFPPGGTVHFNVAHDWSKGDRLDSVSLHEFGHTLGLEHSQDARSIMYAYNTPEKKEITTAEINELREAYGPKPGLAWVEEDTIRISDSPIPPDVCASPVDAVMRRRGEYLFFRGSWIWKFSRDRRVIQGPWRISQYYGQGTGKVERVQAAVEIDDDVYLFSGDEAFVERAQHVGPALSLRELGIKESDRVDVAFTWHSVNYEGKPAYYFMDEENKLYYRFDPKERRVMPNYPKRISLSWKEAPEDASAAFEFGESNDLVFVKGTEAYLMANDENNMPRLAHGFPVPLYSLFPACEGRGVGGGVHSKHHHGHNRHHHHHHHDHEQGEQQELRGHRTSLSTSSQLSLFLPLLAVFRF